MLLGNPARELAHKCPRAYRRAAACQQDPAEVGLPNGFCLSEPCFVLVELPVSRQKTINGDLCIVPTK